MVIKINPARVPVWRSPNTLQLGLGSEALVIGNMRADQEKLINLLYRGIADGAIQTISRSLGSTDSETNELLNRLAPALLAVPDSEQQKLPTLSDEFVGQAFAEIIRASFSSGVDGLTVLRTRAARVISLEAADSASLLLALALASAGVGGIVCTDNSPVLLEDIGPLGYGRQELGSPRRDALARVLEAGAHPCRLVSANSKTKALSATIFVGARFLPPERYSEVLRGATPHLAIEYGSEETKISPLVRPGLTPCLTCRHVLELSRDSEWTTIATALQFRHERLDDAQATLLATGIALESVLNFLDDPRKSSFEGRTIDHRTGRIAAATWGFDDKCQCRTRSVE